MSDFQGYVCWPPGEVERVLAPVIESASDAAFLAVHQSLPIVPEKSKHYGHKSTVTEAEVLEEFLTFDRDPSVMAVVGPPGSGKSHLIKWLYVNLKSRAESLVLYIPRQDTSLQLVLKRVLSELPGDEAARLREDVARATESVAQRPELAAADVLSAIANRLEYEPPTVVLDEDEMIRRVVTGWNGDRSEDPVLSNWLRDGETRNFLLRDDGVIATNVRTALTEYRGDEASTPVYTPQILLDLPLPGSLSLGPQFDAVLNRIRGRNSEGEKWRAVVCQLLNDCLDDAIRRLIGLSSSANLVEAMSTARRILKDKHRDLILLIEDFALFDRIGQPFIDALVTSRGDDRCALRTAFAITDSPYLKLGETLLSRVGCHFKTGVSVGSEWDGASTLVNFVGRYLNAARLGSKRLEEELQKTTDIAIANGTWVPNACDACQFLSECHSSDGFGETDDAFGLYPLNHAATTRVVSAALQEGKFVPRTLITDVLIPMLNTDFESLASGVFPSKAFESRVDRLTNARVVPPVMAEILKQLQDDRDPHADRRVRTLRFWLEGFATRPVDLGVSLHDAFKLPLLGVERLPEEVSPVIETAPPPTGPTEAPELLEIDRWIADVDSGLTTGTTEKLQSALLDLVRGHIKWNDHLIAPQNKDVVDNGLILSRESFMIERSTGARNPNAAAVRWQIPADAESAVLLKSVLRLADNGFFATSRDYTLVQTKVAKWSQDVLQRCDSFTRNDFPLESAVGCLIACALISGAAPEAYTDPVAALVAAVSSPFKVAPEGTSSEWAQLSEGISTPDREALRQRFLGWTRAAQGEGAIQAFDLFRWVPTASRFLESLTLQSVPRTAPTELRQLHALISLNLEKAVIAEAASILDLRESLDWDALSNQEEVSDALIAAVNDAASRGVFEPGEKKPRFLMWCEDFSREDLRPLQSLQEHTVALSGPYCGQQVLAVVECLKVAALADRARDFLQEAETNIELSIQAADRAIEEQFLEETPEHALATLNQAIESLKGSMEEIEQWVNE